MEIELIKKLLTELDPAQYISVLRTINQVNRKLRITGFTKMEKAPITMVVNSAKNSEKFKMALLASVMRVISPELKVDVEENLQDLKDKVIRDQWLGLAAFLIAHGSNQALEKANDVLISYHVPLVKENTPGNTEQPEGNEKKEEKFRQKYMNAHEDLEQAKKEIADKNLQIQEWQQKYRKLCECNENLEQQCRELNQKIEQLNDIQQHMNEDIIRLRTKTAEHSRAELHIFAPNCQDVLEKFTSKIRIDFSLPENLKLEDVIKYYDQIWVFPDLVPFGVFRALRKMKNTETEKIRIFQSLSSLISHAYRVSE